MTTNRPRSAGKLVAAGAAVAILTAVPLSAAAAPSQTTASRLTARALFAKVHRAYLHVPAVEMSVIPRKSTFRFPRRFVFFLKHGQVVAEEFTRSGRNPITLVATTFRHTYARPAGAACWRRLPSSDPQTLTDVGTAFPYTRTRLGVGDKALPPARTASGWIESTDSIVKYWFLALQPKRPANLYIKRHLAIKRFITYTISGRSHRITTLFIQTPSHRRPWLTATFKVTALAAAPRLPTPKPLC